MCAFITFYFSIFAKPHNIQPSAANNAFSAQSVRLSYSAKQADPSGKYFLFIWELIRRSNVYQPSLDFTTPGEYVGRLTLQGIGDYIVLFIRNCCSQLMPENLLFDIGSELFYPDIFSPRLPTNRIL